MERKKYFEATEYNTIKEVLYKSAEKFGDKSAFVIKNKEDGKEKYIDISYSKFLEDINSVGTAFYSMNLKNKRVAVMGKNRYEWMLAHLSNLLGSIVSVPIDKDLQLEELENSLIRSKANAIVFDIKLLELIEQIKERNKTQIQEYICMEKLENYKSIPELLEQGKKLIEDGNKEFIENKIDENVMSIMLFTSGTTSKSKAVMLSQKNLASNVYALQCVEDIRCTDTNIAFLPFHHIFGSTCMLIMLANGAKTAFPDGLRYIKQNLNEYKVSVFVGVPVLTEAIYKAVMKEIDKQGKTKLIKCVTKITY